MESRKRAITDIDKQYRYEHIIDTVDKLLESSNFREITMARIAAEAGLAKGTLFLYFQTKEDVFLSLAERKMTEWSSLFENQMRALLKEERYIETAEFVELVISSLENQVFIKLLAILDDTLEQNVDFQREVEFKTFLKEKMAILGECIEAILFPLSKGEGVTLLMHLFVCLVGVYKVSNPSATVKQVTREPGLEMFDRDFATTLRDVSTCLVIGYIASRQTR